MYEGAAQFHSIQPFHFTKTKENFYFYLVKSIELVKLIEWNKNIL